jgi:hypothetical protein
MNPRFLASCVLLLAAQTVMAATFIVPADDELILKAQAIATGTVEGSYVQEVDQNIETVAEIRVERAMKGSFRAGELIRVVEPGGVIRIAEFSFRAPRVQTGRARSAVSLERARPLAHHRHDPRQFRFTTSTKGVRVLVRERKTSSDGIMRDVRIREGPPRGRISSLCRRAPAWTARRRL